VLHNQFRNALYSANKMELMYISALVGFLSKIVLVLRNQFRNDLYSANKVELMYISELF
jgi:hypothetical protein